jgi:hypothetical protein
MFKRNSSKAKLTNAGKVIYLVDDSYLRNSNPKTNRKALIVIDDGTHLGINGLYSFKGNKKERFYLKRMDDLPIFTKDTGVHWRTFFVDPKTGKMFKMSDEFITDTGYRVDNEKNENNSSIYK